MFHLLWDIERETFAFSSQFKNPMKSFLFRLTTGNNLMRYRILYQRSPPSVTFIYIFGHVYYVNVCRCEFFQSYSPNFGHIVSVMSVSLSILNSNSTKLCQSQYIGNNLRHFNLFCRSMTQKSIRGKKWLWCNNSIEI